MGKRKIKVSSAKAKARRLQKEIAEDIAALLEVEVGRDEVVAPREMGQSGVDVRIVGENYRQKFPFATECKWQERWDVPTWIKEAELKLNDKKNTKGYVTWVLFFKKNRTPVYALIEKEVFFKMVKHLDVESFIKDFEKR